MHESQVAGCLSWMGPTEKDFRCLHQQVQSVRLELQVLLHPPISQALAGLTRMDLTLSFPAVHEQVPIARVQHEGVAPGMLRADSFDGAPVVQKMTGEMRKNYLSKSRGEEVRGEGGGRVACVMRRGLGAHHR